jgi:hypothetical protein
MVTPGAVPASRDEALKMPSTPTDQRPWASVDALLLIADIAKDLNESNPLETTLDGICARIASATGALFSVIRVPDSDRQYLVARGTNLAGFESNRGELLSLRGDEDAEAPSVEAFMSGQFRVIVDMEVEPGVANWRDVAREQGFRSMICIPLIQRSDVIGILNCYWQDPHAPAGEELELLQVVGRLAGVAIETARAADKQRANGIQLQELRDRLQGQNHDLVMLAKAQSRFITTLVRGGAAAVEETAHILAETVRRSVVIADASGRQLSSVGSQSDLSVISKTIANKSAARSLQRQDLVLKADVTLVKVGDGPVPLAMIAISPSLDDDQDVPMLIAKLAADVVAGHLHASRSDRSLQAYARPATLLAVAHGLIGKAQLRDAAGVLGITADASMRLSAIRCPTAEAAHRLAQRLGNATSIDWPVIAATGAGKQLLVLSEPKVTPSAAQRLRERYPEITSIGVSLEVRGLLSMVDARVQAELASQLATENGGVIFYDQLGVFAELARDLSPSRLREHVEATIGPIKDYDQKRGSHLMQTLSEYLSHDGRAAETAHELGIHPNTLQQRLNRAAGLAGMNFDSMYDLGRLVLAMDLARLIGFLPANVHDEGPR